MVDQAKRVKNSQNGVQWERAKALSGWVVALLLAISLFGVVTLAVNPGFNTVIQPGSQIAGAKYILASDGTNFFARNGHTGGIDSSGSASVVLQYAVNNAAPGRILVTSGTWILPLSGTSNGYGVRVTTSNLWIDLAQGVVLRMADSQLSGSQSGSVLQIGNGVNAYNNITVSGPGVLDGNRVTNSVSNVNLARAIYVTGPVTDVRILNVDIRESSGDAIYMVGASSSSKIANVLVQGTIIEGNGEGIVWSNADHIMVTGNMIRNIAREDAIEPAAGAFYWSITNNAITTVAQSCVNPYNGARWGIISGNFCYDTGKNGDSGITIDGVNDVVIANNVIHVTGNGTTQSWSPGGIRLFGTATNVSMTGNFIARAGSMGIGLPSTANKILVANNIIEKSQVSGISTAASNSSFIGNTLRNNDVSNAGGESGLLAYSSGNITIEANTAYDDQTPKTQNYGIYLLSTVFYATVQYNVVYGDKTAGILNQGGSTNKIRWNTGYATENSGTVSAGGGTSFVFNHGLVAAAVYVSASFNVTTCGDWGWTSSSTQITITTTAACTGAIYWYGQTWTG